MKPTSARKKTYNKILNLVKKCNFFVYSGRLSPNRFMVLCACKVRGKHDQSCCVSHHKKKNPYLLVLFSKTTVYYYRIFQSSRRCPGVTLTFTRSVLYDLGRFFQNVQNFLIGDALVCS